MPESLTEKTCREILREQQRTNALLEALLKTQGKRPVEVSNGKFDTKQDGGKETKFVPPPTKGG